MIMQRKVLQERTQEKESEMAHKSTETISMTMGAMVAFILMRVGKV